MFKTHRPGQAKASRTVAFLGGLVFIAWGCRSLLYALDSIRTTDASGAVSFPLKHAWNQILGSASSEHAWSWDLIVIDQHAFSPSLTAALVVLAVAGVAWHWLLNRPRVADHLVEMEEELHKVSWPSFPDAWQSTLVVSGFTALIVVLVFAYDIVIKTFVELIPTSGVH